MTMLGQTWLSAAVEFMGMWVVMMVAMMLPSLAPMLSTYRRSVHAVDETRLARLTTIVAVGYFTVWAAFGAAAYPLGVILGAAGMRWPAVARAVPVATGVTIVLAGCVQLTTWKSRQLGRCRDATCGRSLRPNARSAWRHGLHLGTHCSLCCSGFMTILLVTGVMDPGAMTVVAAAITFERLAPRPDRAARAAGVVAIATGALVIARALRVA
jgi:predicted metal-binding membrane protein